jgi:hypothetical protein
MLALGVKIQGAKEAAEKFGDGTEKTYLRG